MPREEKMIATNKKAYHDYFVDEVFEAGIVLTGTEVKSLRENKTNLRDSFATIRRGEVWLHGVHISPDSHGNRSNVRADRERKLLLRKAEIRYLVGKTKERGFTLVPLKVYFIVESREGRDRPCARQEALRQARCDRRARPEARRRALAQGAHEGRVGAVRTAEGPPRGRPFRHFDGLPLPGGVEHPGVPSKV